MGDDRLKNKIKSKMILICMLGTIVGRILNRVLSIYFGNNGSNMLMALLGAIILCIILVLIVMKRYLVAVISFVMVIPLIIGGIGLYLNNIKLMEMGVLSIFIIYPMLIKVMPRFKGKL